MHIDRSWNSAPNPKGATERARIKGTVEHFSRANENEDVFEAKSVRLDPLIVDELLVKLDLNRLLPGDVNMVDEVKRAKIFTELNSTIAKNDIAARKKIYERLVELISTELV